VLVVEDDPGIRLVITTVLEEEGYEVLQAESGEQALELGVTETLDIALVDLRLPGIHGLDVVRSLRAQGRLPIVIVTAQSDSHDVVAGLEAGADDYIVKPFVAKELTARLRALLRRSGPHERPDGSILLGDLEIRTETAELLLRGEPVTMSRTEFLVMQELAEAGGAVISRGDLLKKVWGYGGAGDGRVVDNLIYRLRLKLEDDPSDPKIILTARGFGYRVQP
jgi:DNA-binding response OmpR family regulator